MGGKSPIYLTRRAVRNRRLACLFCFRKKPVLVIAHGAAQNRLDSVRGMSDLKLCADFWKTYSLAWKRCEGSSLLTQEFSRGAERQCRDVWVMRICLSAGGPVILQLWP